MIPEMRLSTVLFLLETSLEESFDKLLTSWPVAVGVVHACGKEFPGLSCTEFYSALL